MFVISTDTLKKYGFDEVRKNNRALVRYRFTRMQGLNLGMRNKGPEDSVSCREFGWLRPAKWCYIEWGGGKSLSGLYAGRELLRVYVFDYDTILKYGYKDCRLHSRILARYDIPKAIGPDVQKRFKQIDYPPTPAMRDAGIGIYLTDDGKKDAGDGW